MNIQEKISRRAREIKPSATLAINRQAKQLKQQGVDVINLSVGEPDFDTPDPIKEAAIAAIRAGFTKYTEESGALELRAAICAKLQADNGLAYEPDQIVVSNGAKHSLFNALTALLDPDDEVIIPAPYWVSYPAMVSIAGGKPVFCRWNNQFKIDLDHLKELITPKTKILILNSPSNPTGVMYRREELEELAAIIVRHQIVCISDEIYERLTYDGAGHVSIASLGQEIRRLTVVVNGVSKTFAMTGWRIGYIAAEKPLAAAIATIQGQTTSNASSISQKAAVGALQQGNAIAETMVREFGRRREFIIRSLPDTVSYPKPEGAFYFFLKIDGFTSENLARRLLEEKRLAVVPGKDFGADDYIRISFATSLENLTNAVGRLREFVAHNT